MPDVTPTGPSAAAPAPRATQRMVAAFDRLVSTAVLFREAARTSRRWQTFAARTGFSAALLSVLLLGIHGAVTATNSSLVDAADLAWLGRGLFTAFAVAQLGLVMLLAPLTTSTAVIEEAEQGTLDLLLLTHLAPTQILAGKIVSRLLVMSTVVLGALPLTILVVNLGGVSGLEVVALTVHTLTATLLMGVLGAFFALFTRSPMLCVLASASYAIPFFLVLPGAYAMAVADMSAMAQFSPFAAAVAVDASALITPLSYLPSVWITWKVLEPLFVLKTSRAGIQHAFRHDVWRTFTWLKACGAWAVAGVTLAVALPVIYAGATGTLAATGALVWLARAWVWLYSTAGFALATWAFLRVAFDVVDGLDGIFHPKRKVDDAVVDVGTNPVWWREARTKAWMRVAAPLLSTWLLVLLGVFQTGWWLLPGGILVLALCNAAVALVLTAWMGTRSLADERRRSTLEPLLTTTMPSWRIVGAKAAGVAFATSPLVVFTLPLLGVGMPHLRLWDVLDGGDGRFFHTSLQAGFAWSWFVAFWLAVLGTSMIAGLRVRNPRSAFGFTAAGLGAVLLLPAALGRVFPDLWLVALPARLIAPPLAGGASLPLFALSTLLWSAAALALMGGLSLRLRQWALGALAVCLALGAPLHDAQAQGIDVQKEMERLNGLKMRVMPLADGLHRRDGLTSLHVVLENTGGSTRGTLSLVEQGNDHQRTWSREVELAEGARKGVELVLQATGRTGDRTLTFLAEGGRTALGTVRLQPVDGDTVLVGVIGRDAMGLPAAVRSATAGPVPGRRPRSDVDDGERAVRTGLIPPDQLPTTGAALASLDWIVWPDADPSVLAEPQQRALVSWVADGGHLLLTATDTHRQLQSSLLQPLLPGSLGPPEERDVDALVGLLGGVPDGTVAPVASLTVDRDAVVLARTASGTPLHTVAPYGLGSVSLVSASVGLAPLSELPREQLWRGLLFLPAGGSSAASEVPLLNDALHLGSAPTWSVHGFDATDPGLDWENVLRGHLDDIPGVSPLPLSWLVAFAGLYLLVIGPVDYVVLRWLKREPLTWVTFPVAIAVFTTLAIVGTRYTKGSTAILTRVEVVDVLPDAGLWRGDTFFGIFSTRKVALTVTSGFDDGVVLPLQQPGFLPEPTLTAGGGPGRLAYGAETWTLAYGRSTWSTPTRGQVRLESTDDGWVLHNELGVPLSGGWIFPDPDSDAGHPFEAVADGASVRIDPDTFEPAADAALPIDGLPALLRRPPLPQRGDLAATGDRLLFVGLAPDQSIEPLDLDGLSPTHEPVLVVRQLVTLGPKEAP